MQATLSATGRALLLLASVNLLWAPLYVAAYVLYWAGGPYRESIQSSPLVLFSFILAGALLGALYGGVLLLSIRVMTRLYGPVPLWLRLTSIALLSIFSGVSWAIYGDDLIAVIIPRSSWDMNASVAATVILDQMVKDMYGFLWICLFVFTFAQSRSAHWDFARGRRAGSLGLALVIAAGFAYVMTDLKLVPHDWAARAVDRGMFAVLLIWSFWPSNRALAGGGTANEGMTRRSDEATQS